MDAADPKIDSGFASTCWEALTILEQAAKETKVSLQEVEDELWRELAERRILCGLLRNCCIGDLAGGEVDKGKAEIGCTLT